MLNGNRRNHVNEFVLLSIEFEYMLSELEPNLDITDFGYNRLFQWSPEVRYNEVLLYFLYYSSAQLN